MTTTPSGMCSWQPQPHDPTGATYRNRVLRQPPCTSCATRSRLGASVARRGCGWAVASSSDSCGAIVCTVAGREGRRRVATVRPSLPQRSLARPPCPRSTQPWWIPRVTEVPQRGRGVLKGRRNRWPDIGAGPNRRCTNIRIGPPGGTGHGLLRNRDKSGILSFPRDKSKKEIGYSSTLQIRCSVR